MDTDCRKLSPDQQEEPCRRAVSMFQKGVPPTEVADLLGTAARSVFHWLARYRSGGWDGLKTGSRSGRPSKLDDSDRLRAQACLDVSKAFPESELGEDHAQELVPRRERPAASRHWILGYASLELLGMHQGDHLGEDELSLIHEIETQQGGSPSASSNRSHQSLRSMGSSSTT